VNREAWNRDSWIVIREKQNHSYKVDVVDWVVFYQSPTTRHRSRFSVSAVQFEKLDRRGFLELDAEVAGDLAQGVIEVRKMIDGHIANESPANFVVAGTAVQPAKEEKQLEARGETNHDPIGIHRSLGAQAIFCVI
jgi:hypothetical protein